MAIPTDHTGDGCAGTAEAAVWNINLSRLFISPFLSLFFRLSGPFLASRYRGDETISTNKAVEFFVDSVLFCFVFFCRQLPMHVTAWKEKGKQTHLSCMGVRARVRACVCWGGEGDKREYSSRRINSCYSDLHGSLRRKHRHCPKSLPALLILIYF